MRYYNISITNPKTGAQILPASLRGSGVGLTSLFANGLTNPAALNIELDLPITTYDATTGGGYVRIWGIGLQDMGSSMDLQGSNIVVSGGMAKGLPLANPAQQGVLVQGQIFQAFGNWIGTDQTLDFIIMPSTGTQQNPSNIVFNWLPGTPIATAIGQTLSTAFPNLKQKIQVSQNVVLSHTETGYYQTLTQFAQFVNNITKPIIGGSYQGIRISINADTVSVWDGTVQPAANAVKQIRFEDMVGQPTWKEPLTIAVQFVMRGDLNVGDTIHLPASLATVTEAAYLRFQDKSTFTGDFLINYIRHVGNFRQPDAASWSTTVFANPVLKD